MAVQMEGFRRCQYIEEGVRIVNSFIQKYSGDEG